MSALLLRWRVPARLVETRWRGPQGVLEAVARRPQAPLAAFVVPASVPGPQGDDDFDLGITDW